MFFFSSGRARPSYDDVICVPIPRDGILNCVPTPRYGFVNWEPTPTDGLVNYLPTSRNVFF